MEGLTTEHVNFDQRDYIDSLEAALLDVMLSDFKTLSKGRQEEIIQLTNDAHTKYCDKHNIKKETHGWRL